ncbi:GGDEF domain-containing protein [Paenibacillus cremeus]|uniref:GGDEF domain-containing protein n=1 Tax=Paenibacillus cremeus TaxID=2163881 RepID=A0A559KFJ0_9BACL|nr:GGDEF domain-containing protein [Paenibacillus cremeus]TVY10891.1 GGDEF domain-containing protein [Paenibacillus cremeus]
MEQQLFYFYILTAKREMIVMKGCRGRLLGLAMAMFNVLLWYFHSLASTISMTLIDLMAILVLGAIFWWLGSKYDEAKVHAEQDVLTGVYNRRFIYTRFPALMEKMDRKADKLILFVIDIDDFKGINDAYGHETGDCIIQLVAEALKNNSRKQDLVVRWGGDEFIVVAPAVDEMYAYILPELIERDLHHTSQKIKIDISLSIGQAVYPNDGRTLEALFQSADNQMYHSKSNNKVANLL